LTFAGDGSDLETLKQQAAQSRYSSRINVLGPVPHADLLISMQQALATITPTQSSLSEGRCMSALESLLVGTPVIAPEIGAFPYMVKHQENGLLYRPDSVPALAQAMTSIANDTDFLAQLRSGARRSGKALMQPERTFLQCLIEATR
jgi:glycosyltransferase involved in cell wall biosynthesis